MARSRYFTMFRIGVSLAGLLMCLSGAQAQAWKQIGSLPPASDLRCAYFWDTAHGVVAGANYIYTYRSGVWAQASYPEQTDTFKSLRLLNGVNLYAASGVTCVWESTDSGATWQKTSALLPKADDIYLDTTGHIRGMNVKGSGMMQGSKFAETHAREIPA